MTYLARTPNPPLEGEGCAHVFRIRVGPLTKCTFCGDVDHQPIVRYDANCPDCEFETHRCGHCGQTLDHTEAHRCPKVYG